MKKIITILSIIMLTVTIKYAIAANNADYYKAQQELSKLGYSVGVADGIYGRNTKNALKNYQRANNLKITGWLDAKTKALLFKVKVREPRGIGRLDPVIKNTYKNKRALVIGINAYPDMPLEAAVADATAVSKRLKELNFEVTTLIDSQATKHRIQSELGTRLARTTEDDQVLIYFAGHGVSENLHNNKLEGYILPVDVNLKDLYATAISMTELRDLTHRIPAKHILYVFDSCYSGLGLTRATTSYTPKYLSKLAGKRAAYMITAGKAGEVAREVGKHGIFTLNFLDGIAGAADSNTDNVVQASELGIYLARAVSKDTKNEQTPQHGLLEGDGDFLFPLQDDDPIRLKESQLVKLNRQTLILSKRQDLQTKFDEIEKQIQESDKTVRIQSQKKIAALDKQIQKKQAELAKLSKAARLISTADLNRSAYSVMRFLNTGIEFNILKTFPNLEKAEQYYSKVFGMELYLDQNGNQKDDERKILLSRNPIELEKLSGIISSVIIETETISNVLKDIKDIDSELRNNHTSFVKAIYLVIKDIDKKRLTFEQIKKRLIARYGKPTSINDYSNYLINWKTGKKKGYNMHIWSDKEVSLKLTPGKYSYFSYNKISIVLNNNSSILKSFYDQAYKIAKAQELIIEKKTSMDLNF